MLIAMQNIDKNNGTAITTNVAYVGNSMLYFNDTPRFVSKLVSESSKKSKKIHQDSCLRGGASLISIYNDGNGMQDKFNTKKSLKEDGTYDIGSPDVKSLLAGSKTNWDYIVMNDFSQGPARLQTREETAQFLQKHYASLLRHKDCNTIPIFMMTAAYRKPCKGSDDLGNVCQFTHSLYEGYQLYVNVLNQSMQNHNTRIAPVGNAFYAVYLENKQLWEKLFFEDNFHPSICGTFLQGCVLHWTIYGAAPCASIITDDSFVPSLWQDARRHYPADSLFELYFPTKEEALYLMTIAEKVCKEEPTINKTWKN